MTEAECLKARELGRVQKRAWRAANPGKVRQYERAWRAANREKARSKERARREADLERIRAAERVRRAANVPKASQQKRAWRAANLARARETGRAGNQRRRASCKTDVSDAPTAEQLAAVLLDPCLYCGAPAEHVDHFIPLARGGAHHVDNLVAACKACNLSKGPKLPDVEWTGRKVKA